MGYHKKPRNRRVESLYYAENCDNSGVSRQMLAKHTVCSSKYGIHRPNVGELIGVGSPFYQNYI